jgi:RNA polymerase sigma-70 factor (ECF subfamily)
LGDSAGRRRHADKALELVGSRILRLFVRPRVLVVNKPTTNAASGMSDTAAFTTFMRSYQDMVYTTAIRLLGNSAQAEDISQEVFVRAYDHFDELHDKPGAGGWLKTVATNLSINHLQRYRKRWRFFSELIGNDNDGADQPTAPDFAAPDHFLDALDAADRREWVQSALERLPDKQRVPLVLYHYDDLSYEEISAKLGVSLSKVKTDIQRARQALAAHLHRSADQSAPRSSKT